MTENIIRFLKDKERKLNTLEPQPIVLKWLDSPRMKESLAIIDNRVEYLFEKRNLGGSRKLWQWFLVDDKNFNAITAERYIIHYLQTLNPEVSDNLHQGIDAHFKYEGQDVGIEITTLNGLIADWILAERLTQYLVLHEYLANRGLYIEYSWARIQRETQAEMIYDYIHEVGTAIINKDSYSLNKLNISVDILDQFPGDVSWACNDRDSYPWFQYLTTDLLSKLAKPAKQNQLNQYSQNLIFVGVNHLGPNNWAFPSMFRDIKSRDGSYEMQIDGLTKFWQHNLQPYPNIWGICYFFYSLQSTTPFYPLHIFWRNQANQIPLKIA